jgi:predicted ATPase/DNA-binding SARP family transcriptional activator
MPNALRIGLLGPLQLRGETGSEVHLGGRQLRVLLTLLALNAGRVVPAATMTEQLWPGAPPGNPGNALQTLVSRLRAELRQGGIGDVIESHPSGYRLAVAPGAVDVMAFEALAQQGRRALAGGDPVAASRVLREALHAWRGQPLTDVVGHDFADVAAARLTELRSSVLADRIEADLLLGEGASLTGELRALLAADPLAERARALLMRALYAAGRQAEALAVYREGRKLLADQLGVDPSAQLEQVYLRILRGENLDAERAQVSAPAPASAPAGRARAPLTSFVGRDDDLTRVLKSLRTTRLLTLTGPGGVGKTRLAAEASRQFGVSSWFIPLAPVTDPAEVPTAVLDALGVRERVIARRASDPGASPAGRLATALGDREEILVLDNCEHVVEAVAALAGQVLADCPRIRILATSRQPLRIDGETLHPVPPLPVPPDRDNPAVAVASYGSVRLLCDRAAAVRPDFELDDANAMAVARICRRLDGMPLAIELAAVWLRTLTPAQLAERLDDRFALLTGGSRTALPRQRTLRAVVDWSWDLLSGAEQVLARRLAVFPGGAALAAAEQICADALLPAATVLPALSGLVDKSIVSAVQESPTADGPRYRMLETVRAYGLERLAEAGEAERLRDASAAHYLNLAETADPLLRGAGQARWLRELMTEQDNLHAALRWTIDRGDGDTALRFVLALSWYWQMRGQPGEPETLARAVLALTPSEQSARIIEARVVCALMAAGPLWDIDAIRPELTAALADLAGPAGDGLATHPLAAMGEPMLALYDRDPDRSLAVFERYTMSPDPWTRAVVALQRGGFYAMLGRHEGAESECVAALAAFRELGDPWGIAVSLIQLADFAMLRADHRAAIGYLEEATNQGEGMAAWGDMVYIGGKLASIRLRTGDFAGALADLEQAEMDEARRSLRESDSAVWLGLVRAELYASQGETVAAARQCEKVLCCLEPKRSAWWQGFRALTHTRLGLIMAADGKEDRGRALLATALAEASDWIEVPVLAAVIDAIAVIVSRDTEHAELATSLLGAAHTVRGCFDEGSLDAPAVRDALCARLGRDGFRAAYDRGRGLPREEMLTLAARMVADRAG